MTQHPEKISRDSFKELLHPYTSLSNETDLIEEIQATSVACITNGLQLKATTPTNQLANRFLNTQNVFQSEKDRDNLLQQVAKFLYLIRIANIASPSSVTPYHHIGPTLDEIKMRCKIRPGKAPAPVNAFDFSHMLCSIICAQICIAGQHHRAFSDFPRIAKAAAVSQAYQANWVSHLEEPRHERDFPKFDRFIPNLKQSISTLYTPCQIPLEVMRALRDFGIAMPEVHEAKPEIDHAIHTLNFIWKNMELVPTVDTSSIRVKSPQFLSAISKTLPKSGSGYIGRDGEGIIIDPDGLSRSILTACLNTADNLDKEAVKNWHEREVQREVKATFRGTKCQFFNNLQWRSAATESSDNCNDRPLGEFDSGVLCDNILFDFQAKAPRTTDFKNRSSRQVEDPLSQHETLSSNLALGIEILNEGDVAYQLKRGENVIIYIPISVGVELPKVQSIGNSNGIGQVITSLDHMRIINRLLPPKLRIIYWMYRAMAEHSDLIYVDEIDYLEGFWRQWTDQDTARRCINGQVLAAESEIEIALIMENFLYLTPRTKRSELSNLFSLNHLRNDSPVGSKSEIMKALDDMAKRGTPNWLIASCTFIQIDKLSLEEALASRRGAFNLAKSRVVITDLDPDATSFLRSSSPDSKKVISLHFARNRWIPMLHSAR